ncbi:hypothetical protein [Modicisalibacter xianhensis]|nr:hypothetical protein [Halomonas xianhensis]
MTPTRMANYFRVGGILPYSFVAREAREGRPMKGRGKLLRIIDVVARAKARGLTIDPEPLEQAERTIEAAKAELAELERLISARRHEVKWSELSVELTGERLLTEDEIVAGKKPFEDHSGVYFLIKDNQVVYVGQSVNVMNRVRVHSKDRDFDSYAIILVDTAYLDIVESLYIHLLNPPQNGRFTGDHGACAPIKMSVFLGADSPLRAP